MKLIELNHVMSNGQTQIVLLDPNTFNYMINGVGMQEQILRQLVLGAYDDTINQLLEEKKTLK